jgi:hypothetical protein
VHFCRGKGEFEPDGSKNPNFRGVKRKGRKRKFGGITPDYCRNKGSYGAIKGIFAGFRYQSKQKKNANFVSKLAFRGDLTRLTTNFDTKSVKIIENTVVLLV